MADRLLPLFIIKPGAMSPRDIRRAEKSAGILIVECAEPDAVRYQEAPIDAEVDIQARAALSLMRVILNSTSAQFSRAWLLEWFTDALVKANPPLPVQRVQTVATAKKKRHEAHSRH